MLIFVCDQAHVYSFCRSERERRKAEREEERRLERERRREEERARRKAEAEAKAEADRLQREQLELAQQLLLQQNNFDSMMVSGALTPCTPMIC